MFLLFLTNRKTARSVGFCIAAIVLDSTRSLCNTLVTKVAIVPMVMYSTYSIYSTDNYYSPLYRVPHCECLSVILRMVPEQLLAAVS